MILKLSSFRSSSTFARVLSPTDEIYLNSNKTITPEIGAGCTINDTNEFLISSKWMRYAIEKWQSKPSFEEVMFEFRSSFLLNWEIAEHTHTPNVNGVRSRWNDRTHTFAARILHTTTLRKHYLNSKTYGKQYLFLLSNPHIFNFFFQLKYQK